MNTRKNTNSIFIGTSLDGYITDKNGGLEWLNMIPNPDHDDMGYTAFTEQIDALVMGRTTFEMVCSFDIDWPYKKPVFVLSNSINEVPEKYKDKVFLAKGILTEILNAIHKKGLYKLYIDGGVTIQNFLKEDLIDNLIITRIPVLLGGGSQLFSVLPKALEFEQVETKVYLNELMQAHYRRKRG